MMRRILAALFVFAGSHLALAQPTCVGDKCVVGGTLPQVNTIAVSGPITGNNLGLFPLSPVAAATIAALSNAPVYNNGSLGINATLTATTNGALTIDGYSVVFGDRVLVKNQALPYQNGIYQVTATGGGFAKFQLVRTTDAQQSSQLFYGVSVYAVNGGVNGKVSFVLTTNPPISIGQTGLVFTQFTAQMAGTVPFNTFFCSGSPWVDAKCFGAKGDAISNPPYGGPNGDGTTTSGSKVFTSASGVFQPGDCAPPGTGCTGPVNKVIAVNGAGPTATVLATTITGYTSATQVTLGFAAGTSITNANYVYGTDDTVAVQAAANLANTTNGNLYFPPGHFCVPGGIVYGQAASATGYFQNIMGSGTFIPDSLDACGRDVTTLTLRVGRISLSNMMILGDNSINATHPALVSAGNESSITNVFSQWGTGVDITGGDNILLNNDFQFSYGTAILTVNPGAGNAAFIFRNKFDQNGPQGSAPVFPSATDIPAWLPNNNYSILGTVVNNTAGCVISNGCLMVLLATGTSGSSSPTVLPYENSFTDGTATWKFMAPYTYYSEEIQSGLNIYSNDNDHTGVFYAGVVMDNAAGGSGPSVLSFTDEIIGGTLHYGFWAVEGANFAAGGGTEMSGCVLLACEEARFETNFANERFTGVTCNNTPICIHLNGSGGYLQVLGSILSTNSGTDIVMSGNIGNSIIDGNVFTGAIGILLSAGTGDYIEVYNNNFVSAVAPISNSATGAHNIFTNNPGYNPVGVSSGTYSPLATAAYTAGPSPETHYLTGGTVTAVKVASGGTTVCTSTPCMVDIGPNETFSVTYSAAPTDTKSIH